MKNIISIFLCLTILIIILCMLYSIALYQAYHWEWLQVLPGYEPDFKIRDIILGIRLSLLFLALFVIGIVGLLSQKYLRINLLIVLIPIISFLIYYLTFNNRIGLMYYFTPTVMKTITTIEGFLFPIAWCYLALLILREIKDRIKNTTQPNDFTPKLDQ